MRFPATGGDEAKTPPHKATRGSGFAPRRPQPFSTVALGATDWWIGAGWPCRPLPLVAGESHLANKRLFCCGKSILGVLR
ncbi:hypothetical protein CN141_32785 [Sinorhizobium meliloti]|nr:hypothetical protein CN141_32785 [Sinorhizobium meliloti]